MVCVCVCVCCVIRYDTYLSGRGGRGREGAEKAGTERERERLGWEKKKIMIMTNNQNPKME